MLLQDNYIIVPSLAKNIINSIISRYITVVNFFILKVHSDQLLIIKLLVYVSMYKW